MKLFSFWLALTLSIGAMAHTPSSTQVLASVHPLALVAASLIPNEQLSVLVPIGMSPHDFSLRPSDVRRLQQADIILWAGAEAEPYLQKFTSRWPDKYWLDVSQFKSVDHSQDPHWWLSPHIMIETQRALAQYLKIDAGEFASSIQQYVAQAQDELAPLRHQGFWVFHQAYDHFVELMQLKQLGAFTLSPEQKPGARTLQTIRQQLADGQAVCVFSEPEFSPALVETVLKGQSAKRGELDPLATRIPVQKDGYLLYLQEMTQRFKECLTPAS